MNETPVSVVIGGTTYLCPPMPFYCLERAWPHIQRLSAMGALNQALTAAQLQARVAATPAEQESASANVATALTLIEREGADFIGQTREALHVIVAALALDTPPPSYDALSRLMKPSELAGIHLACSELMDLSGLVRTDAQVGEDAATPRTMPSLLNGTGSSPSLRHTA